SYLARHGMGRDDLSKFVEDAVRWRVLDEAVAQTKAANANVPPEELEAAIDEAVQAVRSERFPA
ncbi:MAG: ribbon-helix-helix domain-containing protein, partial [Bryobacteraceae bacterium]